MDKNNGDLLSNKSLILNSINQAPSRFGHSVNFINKYSIIIFGGAIQIVFNLLFYFMKEINNNSTFPTARAAHATVTIRENQILMYGGSIGNGKLASEDLWFLEINTSETKCSSLKVSTDNSSPGKRYGHSMVHYGNTLLLFGGCKETEILNDIWILYTNKTPFKWQKLNPLGNSPNPRVYHTANLFKYYHNEEMIIIYGGRDKANNSLSDLFGLRKNINNQWEWFNFSENKNEKNNEIIKIEGKSINREQHSCIFIGPFLFAVGGKTNNIKISFDVFSMISLKWFNFGYLDYNRHVVWGYQNIKSEDEYDMYLYIYGGFVGETSEINNDFIRIDVIELFSSNEILNNELDEYINNYLNREMEKKNNLLEKIILSNK